MILCSLRTCRNSKGNRLYSMIWIQTVLSPDPLKNAPAQKFWRCGCQMWAASELQELARNAGSRAPPQTYRIVETPWARLIYLCLNASLPWRPWHRHKLENHRSEGQDNPLTLLALDFTIGKLKIIKLTDSLAKMNEKMGYQAHHPKANSVN